MSDNESPVGSPAKDPINEDQEMDAVAGSDRESDVLSEIDEDDLDDYDPALVNIEDRPIDIDEDNARTLKASKRKRTDAKPRKPREGRREKKRRDEDVAMADGSDGDAPSKPARRRAAGGAGAGERAPKEKASSPEPENEENLTPEQRRQRAIDRALDSALKKPGGAGKRRRKDEIVCALAPPPLLSSRLSSRQLTFFDTIGFGRRNRRAAG